ncbi:hypothetical protein [Kitasatospora xanthocidica]|uniref:LppU/SCO3897 family protein n=1 Tax=Kitasatospora xanthocidica TaxID=83382 RepID=UPI001C709220|nr:hypothetical protein [Kitasatospora xanthocidica]
MASRSRRLEGGGGAGCRSGAPDEAFDDGRGLLRVLLQPGVQVASDGLGDAGAHGDPKAEARVVGREDDTTDGENACRKYPTADGYFTSKHGSDKYTLCLQGLETPKQPKPTTIFGPVNP